MTSPPTPNLPPMGISGTSPTNVGTDTNAPLSLPFPTTTGSRELESLAGSSYSSPDEVARQPSPSHNTAHAEWSLYDSTDYDTSNASSSAHQIDESKDAYLDDIDGALMANNERLPVSATTSVPPTPPDEPLASYSCPICFSPPINATLTPCGHICCGSCLFTAVKTTTQRAQTLLADPSPSCPVCRAPIPGWDGKGGGVTGLTMRVVLSL